MRRLRVFLLWSVGVLLGLLVVVWGVSAYVAYEMRPYIFSLSTVAPSDTALVLGASVYSNGTLSPVLKARADAAVALYEAHKVRKILVSGDNSHVTHNEVNPVGNYLLRAGVPKDDIFLDHAGFDTYSSMYRAKEVFHVRSLTVVSQGFHLPRAVFIAQMLGLDAIGADAGPDEPFVYNTARETPATLKAIADLFVGRLPKYLGEPFPISGSGTTTWADSTTTQAE